MPPRSTPRELPEHLVSPASALALAFCRLRGSFVGASFSSLQAVSHPAPPAGFRLHGSWLFDLALQGGGLRSACHGAPCHRHVLPNRKAPSLNG